MKVLKSVFVSLAITLMMPFTTQAKNEVKKAYLFGVATSFNDSTVYITDIQEVDSTWFTGKAKFLISRENYSYQLRDYLSAQGEEHRICMVQYAFDKKKAEKAWNKLYNRYTHNQKKKDNQKKTNELPPFQIKKITKDQFAFEAVAPSEEAKEVTLTKTELKAKKVKAKQALKDQKKAQKEQKKTQKEQKKMAKEQTKAN